MNRQHFELKNLLIIYDCFSKKESLDYLKEQKIPHIFFASKYNDEDNTDFLNSCFPECFFPKALIMKIPYVEKETTYAKIFWKLDRQLWYNYNPTLMLKFLDDYVRNKVDYKTKQPQIALELKKLWDDKTQEEKTKLIFWLKYFIGYKNTTKQQLFQHLIKKGHIDKKALLETQNNLIELALFVNKITYFPKTIKDIYFKTMAMAYINGYKKIFNLLYSCAEGENFDQILDKEPHNFLPQKLDNVIYFFKGKIADEENLGTSPFFPVNDSTETLKQVMEEIQPLFTDEDHLQNLASKVIRENRESGDNSVLDSYWKKYWFLIFLDFFQEYMKKNPKTNPYWIWKKAIFTIENIDFSFLETWGAWNQLKLIKSFELDWLDFDGNDEEFSEGSLFHTLPVDEESRKDFATSLWVEDEKDLEFYFYKNFTWRFPSLYLENIWHLRSMYGEGFVWQIPYLSYYGKWIEELLEQSNKVEDWLDVYYRPQKTSMFIDVEKSFFCTNDCTDDRVQDILMEVSQDKKMVAKSYLTRAFLWSFMEKVFKKEELKIIKDNYVKMKILPQKNKIPFSSSRFDGFVRYTQEYQSVVYNWLKKQYAKSQLRIKNAMYANFQNMFPLKNREKALLIVDNGIFNDRNFTWLTQFQKKWGIITSTIGNKSNKPKIVVVWTFDLHKINPDEYKYIFAFSSIPTLDNICKLDYQKRLLHCASFYCPGREVILIQGNQPKEEGVSWEEAEKLFTIKQWKYQVDPQSFAKLYPFYKNCFFEIEGQVIIYYLTFDIFWEIDIFSNATKQWFEYAVMEENFLTEIIIELYLSWLLKDNPDLIEQALGMIDKSIEKLISNIHILSIDELFPNDEYPLEYHDCFSNYNIEVNFPHTLKPLIDSINNLANKQTQNIFHFTEKLVGLSNVFEKEKKTN